MPGLDIKWLSKALNNKVTMKRLICQWVVRNPDKAPSPYEMTGWMIAGVIQQQIAENEMTVTDWRIPSRYSRQ